MSYDFEGQLRACGLRKADLARQLGVAPATVSRWGLHPPQYVWAYLDVLEANVKAQTHINTALHRIEDFVAAQRKERLS